jgi:hypothetical protein
MVIMAKRGKSTSKRYTGILRKRISVKLPPLEFKGPITTPERARECAREDDSRREIYDQQVVAERERRWSALFKLYEVPPGDWQSITLRLVEAHVPGFRIAAKRGRKWRGERYIGLLRLRVAVENIKRDRNIKTDSEALRLFLKQMPKEDRPTLNTIKKRLCEAKKEYKRDLEDFKANYARYFSAWQKCVP